MNSIQSTALEPTRSEIAGLSFGQKLMRYIPVYGLVILTAFLIILFSLLLPRHFPDASEPALDHFRQGDHRAAFIGGDDPDGFGAH